MLREVKSKTPELEAFEININAVLEAYRTGGLEIKPGMVSYWVDGVQISPLVPRDLKHTVEIAEEHHGRAFWEEKVDLSLFSICVMIHSCLIYHSLLLRRF